MKKYVSDSYTEQAQILTQCTLNGNSRLFGGQMMEWIDITAAIAARRHSGRNVTTVAVDSSNCKDNLWGENLYGSMC
jgi:acyl-CoA hydrolase